MDKLNLCIIVADDETMQRKVLINIIHKLYPHYEVLGCTNGREVYDIIMTRPVDIVLSDIRMPEMDGMELIEKIYNNYPKIKLVLISAFQEFEYAQNAIRYKVMEYLIKPFRIKDVQRVINRIYIEIQKEVEQENSLSKYKVLTTEVKKQDENRFLKNLLEGVIDSQTLESSKFQLLHEYGTVAVIRWNIGPMDEEKQKYCLSEYQEKLLMEHLAFMFPDMFFITELNQYNKAVQKLVMLIPKVAAIDVFQKMEYCLQELRKIYHIIFWAGISNTKLDLSNGAAEGMSQSEEMLAFHFYNEEGGVYSFDNLYGIIELPIKSTVYYENQLQSAIHNKDISLMMTLIEELKKGFSSEPKCYPNKLKHRISSIVVLTMKELENIISHESYDYLLNKCYQMYADCDSFEELFEISKDLLKEAIHYTEVGNNYDAIDLCINYIKSHLECDLGLQKVADQVHFHPNYLSSKIKEKVGYSYSTYILKLRMELACNLLIETKYKVQDIASHCGFSDSNYFNRIFRREYHISPEQYRRVHKIW